MASFQDTVLALIPLLFWRCKDLAGSQITDYSGNDFHGDVVSGTALLGQQSAVETDAEARSVYLPNGFANNICEIDEPPPELLFSGDFTIACFVKHQLTSGSQYLFARGGIANSTSQGLHFRTNGSDTRTLSCNFRTDDGAGNHALVTVSAETEHLIEVDYFVVVTRIGSVVRLHLNDELVGETTGADTNPLWIDEDSNRLVFGAAANNLAPAKGWLSELIICDYGWTAAQITEVYESAINAVFLRGASNVIPTAVLDSTEDREPTYYPFRHNWDTDLIERISFRTTIAQSKTGLEEPLQVRPKPRREIELTQMLRNDAERRALRAKLWAHKDKIWFFPILEDRETLTAQVSAGALSISVDTRFRDYEPSLWAELRELDQAGNISHSEVVQIDAVADDHIDLVTGPTREYAAGATVCPVRRANVAVLGSVRGHTDRVEDLVIRARLLAQDE